MTGSDISRLLAKISNVLDDARLYDLEIDINWETLCEIYDLDEVVGYYNGSYFNQYGIDVIVNNLFKKDPLLFKTVMTYISNRYGLPVLEEYLEEYSYLFNSNDINFENKLDKNNLKMFISFNSADGDDAVKIQDFFKNCNIDCFLSKTDMEISDEYKNITFKKICDADIFIYLLSENSKKSDWCDQEMGMAFMKYKFEKSLIFIVSNDGNEPYGFLSSFHAGFTDKTNYLMDIARKIDEKLDSNLVDDIKSFYKKSLDLKIKELFSVDSYRGAKSSLVFINSYSEFLDEKQLEMICNASITNNQIYEAMICKEPLNNLLSSHKDKIDDDLYQKVFMKINPS